MSKYEFEVLESILRKSERPVVIPMPRLTLEKHYENTLEARRRHRREQIREYNRKLVEFQNNNCN